MFKGTISPINNKKLNISLEICLVLTGDLKNGWINDEIFDIWCDSINLLNGFEADPKNDFLISLL